MLELKEGGSAAKLKNRAPDRIRVREKIGLFHHFARYQSLPTGIDFIVVRLLLEDMHTCQMLKYYIESRERIATFWYHCKNKSFSQNTKTMYPLSSSSMRAHRVCIVPEVNNCFRKDRRGRMLPRG